MPEPASPTVRRRRLAAELRRLRGDLTGEFVAEHMGWSASKVSRIENAHTAPRTSELRKLLSLYGVEGPYADELLALAMEAKRKGWWEAYSDALPDAHSGYIGLEAEATASCHWAPEFVTGLVQTQDYARALITSHARAITPVPPGEIQGRVEARMIRQKILERDPPFELNLVFDESVLLRRIAPGSNVMQGQLGRLIEVSEMETDQTGDPAAGRAARHHYRRIHPAAVRQGPRGGLPRCGVPGAPDQGAENSRKRD